MGKKAVKKIEDLLPKKEDPRKGRKKTIMEHSYAVRRRQARKLRPAKRNPTPEEAKRRKDERYEKDRARHVAERAKRMNQLFIDNPLAFGFQFCPHHFRINTPAFHVKIIKDAMAHRFFACQSPRESAKSTIVTFLMPIHGICWQLYRHIVIVQNTFTKAAQSLETIKQEIKNGETFKPFRISLERDALGDTIFHHPNGYQTRVLCKGAEQIGSLRGEKFGAYRPDLIIVDDLEDDEMVRNPERRQYVQSLFDEALIPAGEYGQVRVMVIGTILHDDSLMAKLVSSESYREFHKLFYIALWRNPKTGNRESLWPEKWSVPHLEDLEANKPEVFAKEYQGDPSSGLMQDIKREDFRYWYTEENQYVLKDKDGTVTSRGEFGYCKAAIACDLAWEEKRESDYTVIMPGILTPDSDLLIDNYVCKKGVKPGEFIEIVFTMARRLKAMTGYHVPIGLEKAKQEKIYKFLLRQRMKQDNFWLETKDLKWETDKLQRIMVRIQPRYVQHSLFHRPGMGDLELQLTRLRSSPHDDLADCVQGLCQLLEFPRSKHHTSTKQPEDNEFMWMRRLANKHRQPKDRKPFVFGQQKQSRFPFKTVESFR